jgi:hypothetical protein
LALRVVGAPRPTLIALVVPTPGADLVARRAVPFPCRLAGCCDGAEQHQRREQRRDGALHSLSVSPQHDALPARSTSTACRGFRRRLHRRFRYRRYQRWRSCRTRAPAPSRRHR